MFKSLRKLGPVAFATYTSISVVSFSSWMAAFYCGLDPEMIRDKMKSIQSYFGYERSSESSNDASKIDQDVYISKFGSFGTIFVISVMAHTLILPVRLALTAALTPHVNRQLLRRNIDLSTWFNKRT